MLLCVINYCVEGDSLLEVDDVNNDSTAVGLGLNGASSLSINNNTINNRDAAAVTQLVAVMLAKMGRIIIQIITI